MGLLRFRLFAFDFVCPRRGASFRFRRSIEEEQVKTRTKQKDKNKSKRRDKEQEQDKEQDKNKSKTRTKSKNKSKTRTKSKNKNKTRTQSKTKSETKSKTITKARQSSKTRTTTRRKARQRAIPEQEQDNGQDKEPDKEQDKEQDKEEDKNKSKTTSKTDNKSKTKSKTNSKNKSKTKSERNNNNFRPNRSNFVASAASSLRELFVLSCMERFVVRLNAEDCPPMAAGANSVHDAIDNRPADYARQVQPRQAPDSAGKVANQTKCYKCLVHKHTAEGFFTGRGKKLFVCKACNSLEARIKRLTEGKTIALLWRDMSADEKASWRAENAELEGAALKEGLEVNTIQKLISKEITKAGQLGEYLPLCVYTTRGYNKQWLNWIEKNANSRCSDGLMTYALRIHYEGEDKTTERLQESLWQPVQKDSDKSKKRAATSSSGSSTSSDSGGKKHKKKKTKKDSKDRKVEQDRKKEIKSASKLMDKCAPIANQLSIVQDKLTPELKEHIPPYQVLDMDQHFKTICNLIQELQKVVKGKQPLSEMEDC